MFMGQRAKASRRMGSRANKDMELNEKELLDKLSSDKLPYEEVMSYGIQGETIEAAKELKRAFNDFMECVISDMQEINDGSCEEGTNVNYFSFDDPPF